MEYYPNKKYQGKLKSYFIGDVLCSETEEPNTIVVKDDGFYCFNTDLKMNIQEEKYQKISSIII